MVWEAHHRCRACVKPLSRPLPCTTAVNNSQADAPHVHSQAAYQPAPLNPGLHPPPQAAHPAPLNPKSPSAPTSKARLDLHRLHLHHAFGVVRLQPSHHVELQHGLAEGAEARSRRGQQQRRGVGHVVVVQQEPLCGLPVARRHRFHNRKQAPQPLPRPRVAQSALCKASNFQSGTRSAQHRASVCINNLVCL